MSTSSLYDAFGNELSRRKQRGILKSIELPRGRGLVRRVYGGLVCLLPASGWFTSLWLAAGLNE